jgi:hypothetical protein
LASKKKNIQKKKSNNSDYIDNKKFFTIIKQWLSEVRKAEDADLPEPKLPDEIGKAFLLIANRYAMKPSFACLPYVEDMIGDAVENCCASVRNFDPEKSNNPFAYFTQVIYYAFLRRIEKETKQQIIKFESIDNMVVDSRTPRWMKEEIHRLDKKMIRKELRLKEVKETNEKEVPAVVSIRRGRKRKSTSQSIDSIFE